MKELISTSRNIVFYPETGQLMVELVLTCREPVTEVAEVEGKPQLVKALKLSDTRVLLDAKSVEGLIGSLSEISRALEGFSEKAQ